MHELGLVYQVVKTVDEVVKQNDLEQVDEIVLQVGEMSDVVPRFIE
ncbi:hydrogenase/urease maturation nickel metallochaperone HypA, partial [Eubacterium sp.]